MRFDVITKTKFFFRLVVRNKILSVFLFCEMVRMESWAFYESKQNSVRFPFNRWNSDGMNRNFLLFRVPRINFFLQKYPKLRLKKLLLSDPDPTIKVTRTLTTGSRYLSLRDTIATPCRCGSLTPLSRTNPGHRLKNMEVWKWKSCLF